MIYRLIAFTIQNGIMALLQGAGIVIAVTTILSILILILNKHFRTWMGKLGIEEMRSRSRAEEEARREEIRAAKVREKEETNRYRGGF